MQFLSFGYVMIDFEGQWHGVCGSRNECEA
jgi:hypothetical protein